MKLKYKFTIREIADDYILIPTGEAALKFESIISTNDVGATIWHCLEKEMTPDEILKTVLEEYEIDESQAKKDITRFINQLIQLDILEL